MGLAESREFDIEEALDEIMPALQRFANTLPRNVLGGKSPDAAWREQNEKNKGKTADWQVFITVKNSRKRKLLKRFVGSVRLKPKLLLLKINPA